VRCHADIAAQDSDAAKRHVKATDQNPPGSCCGCHSEHVGAPAPHEAVGFSLSGHKLTNTRNAFTCGDCHKDDVTTFAPDTCDNCHRQNDAGFVQAHVLSYGTACLNCHDGVDRFGKAFSHAGFAFKLDGRHAVVPCVKCHLDARASADFAAAPRDCHSCHADPVFHAGAFETDCASCHITSNWYQAGFNLSHPEPTSGAGGINHGGATCRQCHPYTVRQSTCTDCHDTGVRGGGAPGSEAD
jgi:hypothetical protein